MVTARGLGGLPARRPDQQDTPPPAGGTPGSSTGIFRGRLVIISGPGSGLFLYAGTPGPGNLVLSDAAVTTTADPFGNFVLGGGTTIYSQTTPGQMIFIGNSPISGNPEIRFVSGAAIQNLPGALVTGTTFTGPAEFVQTALNGPSVTTVGARDWFSIQVASNNQGGTSPAEVIFTWTDDSQAFHPIMNVQPNGAALFATAAPAAVSGRAGLFCDSATGTLSFVSGADSNVYGTGQWISALLTDQTINTIADQQIGSMSVPVVANIQYSLEAILPMIANQTGGTATFDLHGPAVLNGGTGFRFTGVVGVSNNWSSGGNAAGGVAMTNGQVTWVEFRGTVQFSAAGALSIQAHTSAVADTFTVRAGATMKVTPIPV